MPRWIIATACTALQLCLGTVYAWSFFQTMLVRDHGWTFTDTAWAFSIAIFSLGTSAAWAGQALPKLGPRRLALTGSAMFCGGYFIAAFALRIDVLWLFYLGYGVIGGAGIGLGYVTPVATVAKWYPDRKGLATGIVVMGFGVGAFLLSKVLAPLLVSQSQTAQGGDLSEVFLYLGLVFACVLFPASMVLRDPPADFAAGAAASAEAEPDAPLRACLGSREFAVMWIVFFFNISAGILRDQLPVAAPAGCVGARRIRPWSRRPWQPTGATLIAVSSLCNGVGRLLWGMISDRIGRVAVFRILLASQLVVFGVLMTETNPWVFSALVCYVLLCFGGGFATMPSFILDVFGSQRMSTIYGAILTAWAAAGIFGPLYVGHLKDQYPDRAVIYCFLIGILILGLGYVFTYLLNDDRLRAGKPTVEDTLRQFGIAAPREAT